MPRNFQTEEIGDLVKNVVEVVEGPKALLASRSGARTQRRRLLSEAAVLAALQAHFPSAVAQDPGRLGFKDQVALFAGLDVVVGVEGSSLANLVFLPKHAWVVVLLAAKDLAR